jgi:hypothetical protein
MKDPVIMREGSSGCYWRENACGYTSQQFDAGIFDRSEAEPYVRQAPERRIELLPVPENHVSKIAELRAELAKLKSTIAEVMAFIENDREYYRTADLTEYGEGGKDTTDRIWRLMHGMKPYRESGEKEAASDA